jgi:hypothetical protein
MQRMFKVEANDSSYHCAVRRKRDIEPRFYEETALLLTFALLKNTTCGSP